MVVFEATKFFFFLAFFSDVIYLFLDLSAEFKI